MNPNICKHLRSKKMYVPVEAERVFSATGEQIGDLGHCWCNRTMAAVGPDDRQVDAQTCTKGRACFEE